MKTIQEGLRANDAMNKAVDKIKKSGSEMAASIQKLMEASESIGQVTRDLSEIALQTKILALNAGVEAAHAGVHGATFAVVAEQIKDIAERCKKASESTGVIIRDSLRICQAAVSSGQTIETDIEDIIYHQYEISEVLNGIAADSTTNGHQAAVQSADAVEKLEFDAPTMATGEHDIDQQHRNLIDMINQLGEAARNDQPRETVERLLNFLADYAVNHFSIEEQRMADRKCPAADSNKQAHARFLKGYTDWRAKYDAGGDAKALLHELQEMLSKWLVTHICSIDCTLRK